jgi:hypothetical protein
MSDRARRLWRRLEAIHGMIYFVPEADQRYTALGLESGMMGYFASRSAAMGEVTADVVVATFYNFEPEAIRRVVPAAWQRASAPALVDARLQAVDAALRRLLGDRLDQPDIADIADVLWRAAAVCRPEGRPLYAGHASQPRSEHPHLALWQAITLLREYRGDGHIAALTAAGLSGCEALVIHAATGAVPAAVLQATRGWSDAAWALAEASVRQRGWLADDGSLTDAGRAEREQIEVITDRLAADPWAALSDEEAEHVGAIGAELSQTINAAGVFGRLPR